MFGGLQDGRSLRIAGLFAGIGGIELGMHQAGHSTELLCEIDDGACNVLRARFPETPLVRDVREISELPAVDLVAAGFPCQDLSQAGHTAGIRGRNSGLVGEVFRLLSRASDVTWLLLENVPFMLQLGRGRAIRFITDSLEEMGYRWAYRVVDTRAFGLPQRRLRVLLLASRSEDPRPVLFEEDAGELSPRHDGETACGFYWTEGVRGLGWAVDAVPTLKGGSTIGIPSQPAVWVPETDMVVLPDVRDGERLQGFPSDWTVPAVLSPRVRDGHRWKLVGNAVSVPVARWVGERLARATASYDNSRDEPVNLAGAWPKSAWGLDGAVHRVEISSWPVRTKAPHLVDFLQFPTKPLSLRATEGFLRRTEVSTLRFPDGFLDSVGRYMSSLDAPKLFALRT